MILSFKSVLNVAVGFAAYAGMVEVSEEVQPMVNVFDQDALVVAMHGALGGSARWLFLREPWRDGLRLMVLGAILAFGTGSLWRLLVQNWIGDVPESVWAQPEAAYWGAFLVGLLAVVILGRLVDQTDGREDAPDG